MNVLLLVGFYALSGGAAVAPGPPTTAPTAAIPHPTALYVVRSVEERRFSGTGQVFIRGGSTPVMVRLNNNELLALFEHNVSQPPERYVGTVSREQVSDPTWYATRSKDNGASWLPPRPIRIEGLAAPLRACRPTLLVMPTGQVRMYFSATALTDRVKGRPSTLLLAADTRDGAVFRLDRDVRIALGQLTAPRLSAFQAGSWIILLVAPKDPDPHVPVLQFISHDGRSFSHPERVARAEPIGQVVRVDENHLRMFVPVDDAIHTRISSDGIRWRSEDGPCLKDAFDAAVAVTGTNEYLILCSRSASAAGTPDAQPLLSLPSDASSDTIAAVAHDPSSAERGQGPASADVHGTTGETSETETATDDASHADEGWDDFASPDMDSEWGYTGAWGGAGDRGFDGTDASGFAPVADLSNPVDYVAWVFQQMPQPGQNAYESYIPMLDAMDQLPEEAFQDRYNAGETDDPPGPWKPADHPTWEASYQAQAEVLDLFRQASQDPRPWNSLQWPEDYDPRDSPLISLLLPPLARMRGATRATLSQAWRAEDGTVPPEQMRDALSTTLGASATLMDGTTLIENLVGTATGTLARENARWALYQNVFTSADEIEATLDILRERDVPPADPGRWVRFEHAASMDIVQHLFEPAEPGGEPALRQDRVERLSEIAGEEFQSMFTWTPQDAVRSAESLDEFYRTFKDVVDTSWPYDPSINLDELTENYRQENELCGLLLPSLSRAYEIQRRGEASRRATQLVYSVEVFRERYGRYPASLDELPYEQASYVRTDPFTGYDFVYRLGDTGPTIYSAGSDGVDDGGVHAPRWESKSGEPADYVFWPPVSWQER